MGYTTDTILFPSATTPGMEVASPLLFRIASVSRLHLLHSYPHSRLSVGVILQRRRPRCSAAAEPSSDGWASEKTTAILTAKVPPRFPGVDDPSHRRWKEKEAEILRDVEPILSLTKEILHSDKYLDGECLMPEDEKAVVEKLLAYHPRSEDKIGCGLDSIMVDRHPQFRQSRCLFVVRTDGGWIDFSYQKCLRAYIRDKYLNHGERFIREHFKRGST